MVVRLGKHLYIAVVARND